MFDRQYTDPRLDNVIKQTVIECNRVLHAWVVNQRKQLMKMSFLFLKVI